MCVYMYVWHNPLQAVIRCGGVQILIILTNSDNKNNKQE